MMRRAWIEPGEEFAVVKQCALAGVCRSTFYEQQKPPVVDESDLLHSRLIDEEYTRHPFYGSRRMVVFLKRLGHTVNRKRVQRLMRLMGLAGMAPGPNTSRAHPEHKVYPYLLRGVPVVRPNQVWSTDITYIRLAHGFAYLVAVMDGYSRRVLAWRISNSMDAAFCVDCLEDALRAHGKPEIFNSDQGSQFTSEAFTSVLKREEVLISMDGRGRAFDNIFVERLWRNVKHEDVYLKGYILRASALDCHSGVRPRILSRTSSSQAARLRFRRRLVLVLSAASRRIRLRTIFLRRERFCGGLPALRHGVPALLPPDPQDLALCGLPG